MLGNAGPCFAAAQTADTAAADVAAAVATTYALVVARAAVYLINNVGMMCWSLL